MLQAYRLDGGSGRVCAPPRPARPWLLCRLAGEVEQSSLLGKTNDPIPRQRDEEISIQELNVLVGPAQVGTWRL